MIHYVTLVDFLKFEMKTTLGQVLGPKDKGILTKLRGQLMLELIREKGLYIH